jgi:hypothetical protein
MDDRSLEICQKDQWGMHKDGEQTQKDIEYGKKLNSLGKVWS